MPLPVDKLVVAVRAGPASWEEGPDRKPRGLEHDLVAQFAAQANLPIVVVPVANANELAAKLASGAAHLGLGGLYRAANPVAPRNADGTPMPLAWTAGFHAVDTVVIHSTSGYRPKGWADLVGAKVAYLASTGLDDEVARLSRQWPDIRFEPVSLPTADALIERVSEGEVDYALVGSWQASVARNVYLEFDVAFSAGPKAELAWLVPARDVALKKRIDAFVDQEKKSGLIARLAQRYLEYEREILRPDAAVFQERVRTVLPLFRKHFFEAQEATGVEWRLLAAIAYQESQWDPVATSETGVRGFMQLTEETARHLGVADRLDPRESIFGAARYLRDLKSRLPARIGEPDRTWLALAAFNIGLGHLEQARVIAQRQRLNPDLWHDVRQALPLLSVPEHYEHSKLGYARGGMPVSFVGRVRSYYDVLLRSEPEHAPRLRVPGAGS